MRARPENWQRTVRTLGGLVRKLESIATGGEPLKVTFLIRSDTFMKVAFGEYAYSAGVSYSFFDGLRSKCHEIGWHPHMWRWSGDRWLAELRDNQFIKGCLVNGYQFLHDFFPPTSVRIGWNFMSNEIMHTLESLGLQTDFSAQPGIKFQELTQGYGCDWVGTRTTPYFPSRHDYRQPASEDGIKILEMPITCTETPRFVRYARPLADRFRRINRSPTRHEPMNIAKNPIFNRDGFQRALNGLEHKHTRYILTAFHPSDVASSGLFSLRYLEQNLRHLLALCRRQGVQLTTMTATEAADDFLAHHDPLRIPKDPDSTALNSAGDDSQRLA